MSFNNQWHSFQTAKEWPLGSAVLARIQLKVRASMCFNYILINNWHPDACNWCQGNVSYQLIEEPKKQ